MGFLIIVKGRIMTSKFFPWVLAAVSGLLLAAAFPPFGLWPLAWVALVPLFWAVLECPNAKSAANLAGFTGLIFYGISLNWLVKIFGLVALPFWCIFSIWMALHAALLWWLKDRLSSASGEGLPLPDDSKAGRLRGFRTSWYADLAWVCAAGILWTGLEYFRSEVWWLHCSWLCLGYSQVRNLAVLESASIWGVYGLSALIVAANAALVLLFKKTSWLPAGVVFGLLALASIWGSKRIVSFPTETGRPLTVALVQDESFNPDRLAEISLSSDAVKADLLVWPEYSFIVRSGQEEKYLKLLNKKLSGSRAVAVVGAVIFGEDLKKDRMQNFAWVISPAGKLLGRYDKMHPIPYVEKRLSPNPSPRPVETPLGKLGIQICYDLDFENGTRKMTTEGAEVLVVPNLDPAQWGQWQHRQHSDMSIIRAVESGLWVARAASSGYSQIIDPVGRVRASLPPGAEGVLQGTVWLASSSTFYSAWGWLFAPLCLAVTALALAWMGFGVLFGFGKFKK